MGSVAANGGQGTITVSTTRDCTWGASTTGDNMLKFVIPAFEAEGTEVKRVGPVAPNLNAYAERWVQSLRVECLDHFVVLGGGHLRRHLPSIRPITQRIWPVARSAEPPGCTRWDSSSRIHASTATDHSDAVSRTSG